LPILQAALQFHQTGRSNWIGLESNDLPNVT
jgi:hypothetical protein